MAISPSIREKACQFFIQEAPELLQTIEQELLTLGQQRTPQKVHSLMRAAHSIKGGAANVGLQTIRDIAHRLEDSFRALHNQEIVIDGEMEDLLLQGYDCLRIPLMDVVTRGKFNKTAAMRSAEPVFERLEARMSGFGPVELPTAAELGVDMTRSIFEVDVAQGLERMRSIVMDRNYPELAGEVHAQAEVFVGLADLLELPGFAEIAKLIIRALDLHPNQAYMIAQVALSDLERAFEAVMAGDRTRGGEPSAELMLCADLVPPEPIAKDISTVVTENVPDPDPVSIFTEDLSTAEPIPEIAKAEDISTSKPDEAVIAEPVFQISEDVSTSDFISALFGESSSAEPVSVVAEDVSALELISALFEDAQIPAAVKEISDLKPIFVIAEEHLASELPVSLFAADLPAPEPISEIVVAEDISTSEPEEALMTESAAIDEEEELVSEPIAAGTVSLEIPTPPPVSTPIPSVEPQATINVVSQSQTKPGVSQPETELATSAPKAMEPPIPVLEVNREGDSEEELGSGEESGAAYPSVRVDLARLERLDNQVGELAIAQNGQALQNERLQTTVERMLERLAKFRQVGAELQRLSDQMLTSPQENARHVSAFDDSFDVLELDQYSQLHLLLQSASDEMAQIEESAGDIALFSGLSNQSLERQRRMLKNLRDDLMWARMLPLSDILDGFPRSLRELSRTYRKPVDLRISGGHILVDKAALEKLHDPLLHLVRNAFDHGLELPSERQSSGKPEVGRIEIRAYHQGGRTAIEVRDDGRGIHYEQIRRKAVERGWLSQEQATNATKPQLLDLLFEPGFSTAAQTTELSGRGVGLDVVRSQLTALKGTITITSEPGSGTTFSLFIPLTLTVAKLMICIAGGTAYALPSDGIETILVPKADQISESRGQRLLQWRRRLVPMRKLSELLPYNRPTPELEGRDALYAIPLPPDWARPVLLLRLKSQVLAVEIDQIVTEQELVIKPIGSAIAPPGYIYGCTILGDGSVVPVIDGSVLLTKVLNMGTGEMRINETPTPTMRKALPAARNAMKTVLIVDDSQSMRQTLELIFENAGYRVLLARDGREGIEQMQKHQEIGLTLCDVEMPNANGFELLDRHRKDRSIADIPVVMLTSRTGEKHRKMAMHLGATAFISKPQVESELVALVAKYIAAKPALPAAT